MNEPKMTKTERIKMAQGIVDRSAKGTAELFANAPKANRPLEYFLDSAADQLKLEAQAEIAKRVIEIYAAGAADELEQALLEQLRRTTAQRSDHLMEQFWSGPFAASVGRLQAIALRELVNDEFGLLGA